MTDVPWDDVLPEVMRFVQSSMLRGRCYAMLCRRMSLMWRHKLRQAVFRVNSNRDAEKQLERWTDRDVPTWGYMDDRLRHCPVTRLPVAADGVVLVCEVSGDDEWYAYDAVTEDVIWRSPPRVSRLVRCGKRDIAYVHDEDKVVHMRLGDNGRFTRCHEWQVPGPHVCAAGDGVICMRSYVASFQLAVFDTVTGAHMKFRRQILWHEDYAAVSRQWLAVATNSVAWTHDAGVLVCSIFGTRTKRRIFMVQDGWRIEQLHILGDVLLYGTCPRMAETGIRWRARNMATGQPIRADTLLPACGGRMSSQTKRFHANDGKQYIPFRGQVLHATEGTLGHETPIVYCER